MKVEVVSDEGALLDLRAAWHRLLDGSQADPLFTSHDLAAAWWAAYGRGSGSRLHVVCLRGDDGELVGLAPCYLTAPDSRGRRTLRLLGSGGDTSPDYLNVIARSGQEEAVAAAFAEHLGQHREEWDAVLFTDMAEDLAVTDALEAALARAGLVVRRVAGDVCPYVGLPRSVEAHRAALPGHLRRLTTARAKLERQHGARFFAWPDPARPDLSLAAAMGRLAELHRLRFDAKGEAHGFDSTAYLSFHQQLAAALHGRGALRLFGVEIEGRVVAMLYGCRVGDRYYHMQGGFDPEWGRAQVGKLLLSFVIEQAIGEGASCFDFLKGAHGYKDEWATGRRYTVGLVAAPRSLAGVGHLFRHVYRPQLSQGWQAVRAVRAEPQKWKSVLFGAEAARPPRELVRYAAAGVLYHTGLLRAGLRALRLLDRESRLVVLAYHRVLPEELRLPGDTTSVGRRHFDEQVRVLARLLRHPPAGAALAELRGPPARTRPYPMLVTFDDGHVNVRRHAWPALRRRGVPFVFFIPTGVCGSGAALWCDEVTELVVHAQLPALHLKVDGKEEVHTLGDAAQRLELATRLKTRMKALPHEMLTRYLEAVRAACGPSGYRTTERSELLGWGELDVMRREGVLLAAHSHEHAILSRLPREALALDLRQSSAEMVRRAGTAQLFAYPNGLSDDISPAVVDEVRASGFTNAFTMNCGVASAADNPLLLPRLPLPDVPGVFVGLSLARQLASAVARDVWRRWRGEAPREPVAAPRPVVELSLLPALAPSPPPPQPSTPREAPAYPVAARRAATGS